MNIFEILTWQNVKNVNEQYVLFLWRAESAVAADAYFLSEGWDQVWVRELDLSSQGPQVAGVVARALEHGHSLSGRGAVRDTITGEALEAAFSRFGISQEPKPKRILELYQ